ncbi:MAG: DNA gyrase subunit A [Bdellovibrio sp. CG12_big_fil_rev_8_21_14_0_65_39_13]|nr:MAG: DNA gyrase subunit A [Bdellovibrio sp. CG22_combo_CG10-13_8_21_14_all_39_27]PIQ60754.1 MAG: DNA gyrase subunit A [Bdellovibrio sp. CG12_big_fil_rev_8_21_14_0_65_39_13]PIR36378.1 MAG: DNA gyrase subunit A [Bdellovibrio sp. CG11_big_fil_rev_8_21_14_0_20_39_38]
MSDENNNDTPATPRINVTPVSIQDEMKSCYLDYAMSVIVGRALPDVRDGLKPVHRRVLFAMHSLNNYHNRPFLKSARVVGDVIGKYHPHGDSAVYGTIVRMAQDFSMRYPLIDGQGNFGSIDGDSAAAMRYTEIRMKKLSEELLRDLDKETVDWQPNYDDSLVEPKVLPTKVPNLLVNGSAGIAVGMATNIPPHNLSEIMNGLLALLSNPDITIDELMQIIPGPDFPTAGAIHGVQGIRAAYHTGKGVIQIRAKAEIEEYGKDRERIVITELPYQVNKAKLIERIADLVNAKEIEGISDLRDESSREGIRVCVDLKKGEIANVILNRLYKQTQLQESFGIIFLSLNNGMPKVMTLKEQLNCFLDHRREVVIRRTIYELKKAKERAHILEGLKTAVENIDEIVEMIKTSDGPQMARERLQKSYSLSEIQSQAILDMRLQRLTGLERDKIIAEYNETIKEIARLEGILNSEEEIRGIIRLEISEILEAYGDKRRTEIIASSEEIQIEDLVKSEEVLVTITHKGYIKRMTMDTYKTQKRGGTGVKGGSNNQDDDFFTDIFTANTHDMLFFFTNRGTVFSLKVYQIPEGQRTSKGRNLANLINLPAGERVAKIICIPQEEKEGKFLLFATEHGLVKKTELGEYKNVKQSGLKGIKIVDGDNLITVKVSDGSKDVLLCSTSGKIIRFSEEDCRPMGRVSQGVKGISLDKEEKIIGMEIIDDTVEILSITENGYGKRTNVSEYRKQSRGGKGILAMRLTEKNGEIKQIKPVTDKDDLMIITDKGQVIRTKIAGISLMGRTTQGVRIIRLKDGEKVVSVEKIVDPDEGVENEEITTDNT